MTSDPPYANSLADPALLSKIDQLFACGVGTYIDLPQLVVVGDQSSGKGSVLEGLTGLPFPRDSGLCTRFATQITFRRAPVKQVKVTILPAKDAIPEHVATVTAWQKNGFEDVNSKTFAIIMKEAQAVMGVNNGPSKLGTFSNDILKLELSGPDCDHLTLIDVPGIFRRTSEGVTTQKDMKMVRDMVLGYMENPRSVQLAVVPANVDVAVQEILEMAEGLDPKGLRTMGILTKPDLVDKGAEQGVLDLLEGRRQALTLGWHIVRNPGQSELGLDSATRNANESSFFKSHPWSSIDSDKTGVDSLRNRLQEVLKLHVRREFPKVREELAKRIKDCRQQLDGLGHSRNTSMEQSRYLLDMASKFQDVVTKALNTDYGSSDVFTVSANLKIATLVRNRDERFSDQMASLGHWVEFQPPTSTDGHIAPPVAAKSEDRCVRAYPDHPDVADILTYQDTLVDRCEDHEDPNRKIMQLLEDIHKTSRGFELGTFQASILPNAMKTQSVNWEKLAMGYVSDVIVLVHNFVTDLLKEVCLDEQVRETLHAVLLEGLMEFYNKSISFTNLILTVERAEVPSTMDNSFAMNLHNSRQIRQEAKATKHAQKAPQEHLTVEELAAQLKAINLTNDEQTIREIHDILQAYYGVARKRFVDLVCNYAAGHFLVKGERTALKFFDTQFVAGLTGDQLQEIAGEDPGVKRKRKELLKQLGDLEAGKKILR